MKPNKIFSTYVVAVSMSIAALILFAWVVVLQIEAKNINGANQMLSKQIHDATEEIALLRSTSQANQFELSALKEKTVACDNSVNAFAIQAASCVSLKSLLEKKL